MSSQHCIVGCYLHLLVFTKKKTFLGIHTIVYNIFLTSQWQGGRRGTRLSFLICWGQGTILRTGPFQQRLMMQQWLGRSGLDVGLRKRPSVTAADQVCIKTSPGSVFIEPGRKDLGRLPTLKTYPQNYSMGGSLSNLINILLNLSWAR